MDNNLKPSIKMIRSNDRGATILINNVRLGFVSLAKPNVSFSKPNRDGVIDEGTFEVTCLFPKTFKIVENLQPIAKKVIDSCKLFAKSTAVEKSKALKGAFRIHQDYSIIKDGDLLLSKEGKKYDGFEDHYTIKAKTKAERKNAGEPFKAAIPIILTYWNKEVILPEDYSQELYSGILANVCVNLTAYESGKRKGLTVYLVGVQKLKDAPRLGGFNPFEIREDIVEETSKEMAEEVLTY